MYNNIEIQKVVNSKLNIKENNFQLINYAYFGNILSFKTVTPSPDSIYYSDFRLLNHFRILWI